MKEDWYYHRGDIYLANLDPHIGAEQGGTRPVLVLQNNAGNFFAPTLVVAPITSRTWKKGGLPTHCHLKGVEGLKDASVVLLEQIKVIDKVRIKRYLGRVNRKQMDAVNAAIEVSLGLSIPEDTEFP